MVTDRLALKIKNCRICVHSLPEAPKPIVQFSEKCRIVIVGQAPGAKVHKSGVPWDDNSGAHLREWLQIERRIFYDRDKVGLVPMGFCYPGKARGGDAPPRPECAPAWHDKIIGILPNDCLFLLVGQYAQEYYLKSEREGSLSETVRSFNKYLPKYFPLPHPGWRSKIWIKKNPWFERLVLPKLRKLVLVKLK